MKDAVYILGGGDSLKNFDFSKLQKKDVISINKSIFSYPTSKYFITMDFSFLGKITDKLQELENIPATKIFIANFCFPFIKELNGQIIDTRFNLIYDLSLFDMIVKSHKQKGIGFNWNNFVNGNNSGFCALQLAILLGYKNIYLLGYDFIIGENTHFHGGYGQDKNSFNKKLQEYFEFFWYGLNHIKLKRNDINIYNCSNISSLNKILPYKRFEDIQ